MYLSQFNRLVRSGLVLLFAVHLSIEYLAVHGQTTNFLDQNLKVGHFAEPEWFKKNIPFIEIPDQEIEEVYYYRWSTLKRHLRYLTLGLGYTITEFVHRVGYSQKFGTINGAAGHHIYEARWLRDRRYVQVSNLKKIPQVFKNKKNAWS